MIIWLTGNTGAGKTTLARRLCEIQPMAIHLDGDEIRSALSDHDLSEAGRRRQNERVAHLADTLARQGHLVIVSVICPYKDQRQALRVCYGIEFWELTGGALDRPETPYESGPELARWLIHWEEANDGHR